MGSLQEALNDANKAIEIKPDWVRGHHRAAAAYQQLGDLDSAKKAYHEALRCDPKDQACVKGLEEIQRAESSANAAVDGSGLPAGSEEDFSKGLTSLLDDASLWEALKKNPQVAPLLSDPSTLMKIDAIRKDPKLMQTSMSDPAVGAIFQALLMATLEKSNPGMFSQQQQQQYAPPPPQPKAQPAAPPKKE